MPEFLTVKQAAQLVGKSPSSIRRIIYPILQDEQHPDRTQIQPTPAEVLQLRMRGENFAWKLSEELLRREVPQPQAAEKAPGPAQRVGGDENSPLLVVLQRELEIKNQQIAQQSEQIGKQLELISGLSERLREGNILIGSLQQRLAMPKPKPASPVASAEAKATTKSKTRQKKKSKSVPKPSTSRRRFFKRFFK